MRRDGFRVRAISMKRVDRWVSRSVDQRIGGLWVHEKVYSPPMTTVDLLAIAAHRDDVELTCSGTLIKAARQGYKTAILDLTQGEMGTRGSVELRAAEASRAAEII